MSQAEEEDEYEEEEILIFVEIEGLLDREVISEDAICNPQFKIIGLDTDTPYMQIGKENFIGEFRETIGTAVFFETDPSPPKRDETFGAGSEEPIRYVGKTTKHLYMTRILLDSKNKDNDRLVSIPEYLTDNVSLNYEFNDEIESQIGMTIQQHGKNNEQRAQIIDQRLKTNFLTEIANMVFTGTTINASNIPDIPVLSVLPEIPDFPDLQDLLNLPDLPDKESA